jgi:hypothetical protein
MTTDPTDAPLLPVAITPDASNQLREVSRLMVDTLTTVPRSKLGASDDSTTKTCSDSHAPSSSSLVSPVRPIPRAE